MQVMKLNDNLVKKILLIGIALLLVAGIATTALAQSPTTSETTSAAHVHEHEGDAHMSDQTDPSKKRIPHFDPWGNWTGRTHLIDYMLYWEIVDAILAKGGLPTPQNVDRVYHESGYGR